MGRKRSRIGKNSGNKTLHEHETSNENSDDPEWYPNKGITVTGETRRVTRSSSAKKSAATEIEPVAGPSGLCHRGNCFEKVVYKCDEPRTPPKPCQVMWGEKFLEKVSPKEKKRGSILKNPLAERKAKARARFSLATVYYFNRVWPMDISQREMTLGMEWKHFYSNLVPIEVYEKQKQLRRHRKLATLRYQLENAKTVNLQPDQQLNLHTIEVPDELLEAGPKNGVVKNVWKGCSCNVYCDPDFCECNLDGKQCEVFKDGYPCGCQLEYCKNSNGRVEVNPRYVQRNVSVGKFGYGNKLDSRVVNRNKCFLLDVITEFNVRGMDGY